MRRPRRGAASDRPYVICHMVPSIDGRIVTASWPGSRMISAEYERVAASLDGDAWIIGRVSMQPYAGKARLPASRAHIPRTDFVAREDAPSYAIAIDPSGKLRWQSGSIHGDSVLIAPVADGVVGTPTLFDAPGHRTPPRRLKLVSVERRRGGMVWVRYRVQTMATKR